MAKPHDAASRWRVRVRPPRGREVYLQMRARRKVAKGRWEERTLSAETLDHAEAERLAQAWAGDLNGEALALPGSGSDSQQVEPSRRDGVATLGDVMARRIAAFPDGSKTADGYNSARRGIVEAKGDLPVDEITSQALVLLRDRLVATGRSTRTVNSYLRWAGACWRWCEERGLVEGAWPRLRPLRQDTTRKRPFTDAEVVAILGWLRGYRDGRWYPIVALAAETGRRISEVCNLRGRDVDRQARTLTVRQKGGERIALPVSPDVLAALPDVEPDAWLFRRRLSSGGYAAAAPNSVWSVVRRAVEAVGIADGERVDTHSFRRYACGALIRSGVSLGVAMRLTGHKSPAMFMHYQAQWVGDDLRAAVDDARARRDEATEQAADPAAGGPEAEAPAGAPAGEGDAAAVCNTTATPQTAPWNGGRRRNPWAERDSNPRPFACKANALAD